MKLTNIYNKITGNNRTTSISEILFQEEIRTFCLADDNHERWVDVFAFHDVLSHEKEVYDVDDLYTLTEQEWLNIDEVLQNCKMDITYGKINFKQNELNLDFVSKLHYETQKFYYSILNLRYWKFDERKIKQLLFDPLIDLELFLHTFFQQRGGQEEFIEFISNNIEKLTPEQKDIIVRNIPTDDELLGIYCPIIFGYEFNKTIYNSNYFFSSSTFYIPNTFDKLINIIPKNILKEYLQDINVSEIDSQEMFDFFYNNLFYRILYFDDKDMVKQTQFLDKYLPQNELDINLIDKIKPLKGSYHDNMYDLILSIRPHWTRTLSILRPESNDLV